MASSGEAEQRLLQEDHGEGRIEMELMDATESSHISDREHGTICGLLYISHFLSAWNSRVFEFGAFLFLANIYPQTLLPASVYALARAASAALLSPMLGSYLDRTNLSQRVAVAISCILLFLMAEYSYLREGILTYVGCLSALSLLACVEKLGSVLNTISVERDWVVTVACGHEQRLQSLNSRMRRIDLFCKLIGPLTVALVDSASPKIAVAITGGMTVASVYLEYHSIARVYNAVPELKRPKEVKHQGFSRSTGFWTRAKATMSGAAIYARHQAFLPSFSLALLYLTVLSFAGQMITYLVALGLSSSLIGVLRGISALFEISATWIGPRVMDRIGPIRGGIWFINWQIMCVAIACVFLWVDSHPKVAAFGTVCAVIASRVGLWGFDLSAQIIVQEEVESEHRGTFSSQEFALQNIFEMLAFASTIMFPRPDQFRYPATISAAAVTLAGVLYALFVRSRRGHLVHFSSCADRHGRRKDHHHWWMRISNRDSSDTGL
ncbi:Ferriportin iron efflux transporter [Lecanosticta acicola]|uniref:Solute carrier family 40 member n=1 Tax=Lecanosticta acicola TaxID=111012 RepID=A0AAI8Z330_9PEZI|nr:Ferriportin iron efflux transporter [Lecanosticta acicola]